MRVIFGDYLLRQLNRLLRWRGFEFRRVPEFERWISADNLPIHKVKAFRSESKRVIAFSVYGANYRYQRGAIQNVQDYQRLFPGWDILLFTGASVTSEFHDVLNEHSNVHVVPCAAHTEDSTAMLWRFASVFLTNVEAVLIRDADSRPSRRERAAVDEWLCSDYSFHIMRDHPAHRHPIMGGMWGARGSALQTVAHHLENVTQLDRNYGCDQRFLKAVYADVRQNALVHTSGPVLKGELLGVEVRTFPTAFEGGFVGQGFEADGSARLGHK